MPKPVRKTTKKKVAKRSKKKSVPKTECVACGGTKVNSKGFPCSACRVRDWA